MTSYRSSKENEQQQQKQQQRHLVLQIPSFISGHL